MADLLTQAELDVINNARRILKEKLGSRAEQIVGKFTQPKKREVLDMLKLLGIEVWNDANTKLVSRVEGYHEYLTNLWSTGNREVD
jgi:hypothetical protein